MDIETAVDGMMKTRAALRSNQGVTNPSYISEQMQRLAQYTAGVEEHLGELEERLEVDEMEKFNHYSKVEGRSVNQAEQLAKQEVGELKGQVAKLTRYVNGSWKLVGVAQSRFNHLTQEFKTGKHAT